MSREPHPELADDDQLIDVLGRVLDEEDAVPADLVAFASTSLTWRTFGQELAELLFDSARDETVTVRDASPSSSRMLSFGEGPRGVELELEGDRVVGVVRPAGRYRVGLEGPDGTVSTVSEATGMFTLQAPLAGPLRVMVSAVDQVASATDPADPAPLVTAWFVRD